MREIARIRNEHSVEIMKLRRSMDMKMRDNSSENKLMVGRCKENFQAYKGSEKFVENEIERQRRALLEENELLKKRLRAVETIANSGNTERAKFMEGASWIAKKAHVETERHIQRMQNLMGEYERKTEEYVVDRSIAEVRGREVIRANQWLVEQVEKEVQEVGEKFEGMFENVNYHLSEATKQFHKVKQ